MKITEESIKRAQEFNRSRVNYHDRVYPGAITVEELMKGLERPVVRDISMLGNQVATPLVAGTETPNFHYVSFINSLEPMHVGYVGPFKVIIDENLEHQHMTPTPEFRRIQHPDLVKKTNEWMRERFGVSYPIQRTGDTLIMHPKALETLNVALGGYAV